MKNNLSNTNIWLAIAGAAMVVGFFLPIWGTWSFGLSGWAIVVDGGDYGIAGTTRLLLLLCPIAGAGLALDALAGKTKRAANIGLLCGAGILGYTGYTVFKVFMAAAGWGLYLILAAGVVGVVVGITSRAKK